MYNDNLTLNESNPYEVLHSLPSPTSEINNKIKIEDSEYKTTDGILYL